MSKKNRLSPFSFQNILIKKGDEIIILVVKVPKYKYCKGCLFSEDKLIFVISKNKLNEINVRNLFSEVSWQSMILLNSLDFWRVI